MRLIECAAMRQDGSVSQASTMQSQIVCGLQASRMANFVGTGCGLFHMMLGLYASRNVCPGYYHPQRQVM